MSKTILQSHLCLLCLFAAFDAAGKTRIDYSRFSHLNERHRLECQTCHKFPSQNWNVVRKESDAFPDIAEFPDHQSCINCHRRQFFARERPAPRICSNCHVKASPRDTSRFPFPSLGEPFYASPKGKDFVSDFKVAFPHAKHEDSECATCHETRNPQGDSEQEFATKPPKDHGDAFWLKKGTFKSPPLTHGGCFTCHNQESELPPLPQNCDSCHKPAVVNTQADFDQKLAQSIGFDDPVAMAAWRRRSSAGAFRHEVHAEIDCKKCHDVANTAKVAVKSCGGAEGCHVTATADDGGVLNYEMDQRKGNAQFVCVKCHIVFGSRPLPLSHVAALPKSSSQ
ncbi:MAG TPA: cytochrome c3 family protein [Pyrinomonadaceae bacterium]|nr:cytochrome c3 family protein [Pyrinomonadaceae bacterium]